MTPREHSLHDNALHNNSFRDSSRNDARALQLLKRFGHTATAFQVMAPGMRHWFAPMSQRQHSDASVAPEAPSKAQDRGVVGYVDTGSAWVAAGEPISARDETIRVAEEFVASATANGKRSVFFSTEGALAASPRFQRVLIGEQPTWNPQQWAETLASSRSLREQVRRARAKGVAVRLISTSEFEQVHAALQQLLKRWLATRPMSSMHFLVELAPFVQLESRRLFIAERDGQLVGLLSLAPISARNGWLFEHLLRDPIAPNGSLELLVDFAMRALAAENVNWATLGLAPLAGPVAGWLRVTRALARPFFNFRGLAAFKRKLRPTSWEPIYLAYPRERSSMMAMRDGLRAFAGGSTLAFAARTVLRGPKPLLRALEFSLVPWTIALSLWPARPWFPSPVLKWIWVAFDVALLGALYRLRVHWTRRLATLIAAMVTLDSAATLAQTVFWNVARVRTPLEALTVVIACSGPALAAAVLWGAVRRHRVID